MKKVLNITFFVFFVFSQVLVSVPSRYVFNNVSIIVTKKDITQLKADAIVNAAHKELPKYPGGVAGAIWEAAGRDELNTFIAQNVESKKGIHIDLGSAIITPSFALKKYGIKYIIHTVGPDFRINEPIEKLYDSYKSSLLLAHANNLESIAFPAISTGIFGGDKQECARLAIKAICDSAPQTCIKEIYLTVYDDEYLNYLEENLNALKNLNC